MDNLIINIEGGGSREEISKALTLMAASIMFTPINEIDGSEWNDCTLRSTISVEVSGVLVEHVYVKMQNHKVEVYVLKVDDENVEYTEVGYLDWRKAPIDIFKERFMLKPKK